MGSQKNRLKEHPKHMLKLMGKKIFTILHSEILLILTYVFMFSAMMGSLLAYTVIAVKSQTLIKHKTTQAKSEDPDQTKDAVWSGTTFSTIPTRFTWFNCQTNKISDDRQLKISVWNFRTLTILGLQEATQPK